MYANCVKQRITIAEVIENEWFKKGYKPPSFEQADISLADVDSIFNEIGVRSLFHLFFGWVAVVWSYSTNVWLCTCCLDSILESLLWRGGKKDLCLWHLSRLSP